MINHTQVVAIFGTLAAGLLNSVWMSVPESHRHAKGDLSQQTDAFLSPDRYIALVSGG